MFPILTWKGEAWGTKKIHSHGVLRRMWETPEHTALGAQPTAGLHIPPLLGPGLSLPKTLCSHFGPAPGPPRSFWQSTRHLCNTLRNLSGNYTISSGREETHLCDKNTNSFAHEDFIRYLSNNLKVGSK